MPGHSQLQRGSPDQRRSQAERTSDRLLLLLKQRGSLCAAQLSEALGMTEQGVRRHLTRLAGAGLIEGYSGKPRGRGRAQQLYRLTEQGEARFPKSYPSLCVDILHHLQAEYGAEAVGRVMYSRAQALAAEVQGEWGPDLPLEQRLERLTHKFQEANYGSVLEQSGEFYYLTHHNCPHLAVACEFTELCLAERGMLADLLSTEVRCESRASAGGCHCRYRISRAGFPSPAGTGERST
ncbi:MAG: ArsR family transcriptional regulator [Deinococcus sp.]|nr:ArsR family transcriptional regulator [Deinococcus sp.]